MNAAVSVVPSSSRLPIVVGAVLLVGTIAFAGVTRWSGGIETRADAPASMTRSLVFADRADGGIDIVDATSRRVIETVVGEAGFVRGTLRGLARERRRDGIGADVPFRLVAHVDGRLTLLDPATGQRVDLESFGPTNMREFARLLRAEEK